MAITTDTCYNLGTDAEKNGIGWSGVSGADWPFPEARTGVVDFIDDEGNSRLLVLDGNDGKFYDISVREGSEDSGLSRRVKDKVLTDGTGGTDIVPYFETREDRGTYEHYFLVHKRAHLYVRPYNESNRSASGYDSNGYLSGLLFDVEIYADGAPSTASATMDDITVDGDLSYDKTVRANRLRMKVTANKSDHVITGHQNYYIAQDKPSSVADKITTEMDNQAALSEPLLWLDIIGSSIYDRAIGATVSGSYTTASSPDGNTMAIVISAAITTASITVSSGTVMIWYNGTISVTIDGDAITLTEYDTSGSWTLGWATDVTKTGAMVITPTGSAQIFDVRVYNSEITSAQIAYYYNDVTDNSGNIVLAR
jgi:hypothetical protein